MKIHLVGGFLGSGKTTAIIQAVRQVLKQGRRAGVVTNDKGKQLVDTAFFRSADIPTAEVAGGCFRCNFDELEKQIDLLKQDARPDVIFAESVGSCADMAATVLEPLLRLQTKQDQPTSFSVFADARLLRLWLLEEDLPFSDEVVYIFEKQIEESGLLVINKIDLLSNDQVAQVETLVQKRFPEKELILQNSLTVEGVQSWLNWLQDWQGAVALPKTDIDYDKYDAGSRQLAWLDEAITIYAQDALAATRQMIVSLLQSLTKDQIPIGHLKFFLTWEGGNCKLSFPALSDESWGEQLSGVSIGKVEILVNGRVQIAPANLNRMIATALDEMALVSSALYQRNGTAFFQPRIMQRRV